MKTKKIKDILLKELPAIIEEDKEVKDFIANLFKDRYADKEKTEERFDRILNELAADRKVQSRKWEEQEKKWDNNQRVIHELLESIKMLDRKHENTIGTFGSTMGIKV